MKKHDSFPNFVLPQKIIGQTVLDSKGNNCGKIKDLYIDKKTFCVAGIILKKRLSKAYFISCDYFDTFTESGVTLNSVPIKPYDKVIDVKGKLVGGVVSINRNQTTLELESIEVKLGFKSTVVLSHDIIGIGEKITVKI